MIPGNRDTRDGILFSLPFMIVFALFMVYQTAGSNATEVITQIDAQIAEMAKNLPKGVESRDNLTTVNLTFNTQGYASKTINVSQIRVINQPANMSITALDPRITGVVLVGPEEELEALSPNSVVAVVDASDIQIAEGREKLAASIQIPASTTIFATGSYSVECQVSASGAQS